ncbi:MAG: trypsin-like peptidase domain-containing protein [Alphaproteobacteria bacterium]|nr:trypsin-like peptidase domain-containing protein [Alphaproteobacteria bacterium]
MLHLYRSIFICFVVAALSFAIARYTAPTHFETGKPRVVTLAPPESASANQDTPVLYLDVTKIPAGMTARGTSFPIGNGLWLTAQHVANAGCGQVILIIDGKNVPARIKFLGRGVDLAVLEAPTKSSSPLPITSAAVNEGQNAFAFGFPDGKLGAAQANLIGLAHLKFAGVLAGTTPVLAWAEVDRYPNALDSLQGISGGPVLDNNGDVVGIIVATSPRRGRDFTVAPQILREVIRRLGLEGAQSAETPAREAVASPVSLERSANELSKDGRIVETYCIPH